MNISQIEEIVKKLVDDVNGGGVNKDEFIFQLMAAFGHRKTTIGRIKSGERNLAKVTGEVRAKRHIYFKYCQSGNVLSDIDNMKKEPSVSREKIRFIIATDFDSFVALDTRTGDTLDIEFNDLGKHFDFFLPWAGMEKAVYRGENPADVKAAEKMAKLFDLIKADNFNDDNKHDKQALHNLNVFLTRLLFCFFAEDTGIFKQNQFSGELESHTKTDGSDVDSYLNRLFEVLNTPKDKRAGLPDYLAGFEYVNGGLFADSIMSPRFSHKSRKMLIECGSELDWSDINPDIFGSMIQAVVHPDQRGGMGMHYTSVTNIMKVIEPLFLDELYAELENIEDNIDSKLKPSRLRKLHERIAEIKIFDPACGSGNFLIIAFKELRKLEMEIIKRLEEIEKNENQDDLFSDVGLDSSFSQITLSQFYGIELDDFAHEVAILSLWLAEHQMNIEFKAEFGECKATLPLRDAGRVICGNACEMRWEDICAITSNDEVYILGNPPYLGGKKLKANHKDDMKHAGIGNLLQLDYISCWFVKAASYIQDKNAKSAFVSTKSICQGEQVYLLWPIIYKLGSEISFAFKPFEWSNNAKDNAGVTCIILGLQNQNSGSQFLIDGAFKRAVKNISPYLIEGESIWVEPVSKPINLLPPMCMGSNPVDGKNLVIENDELSEFDSAEGASRFLKKYMGGSDFLYGKIRHCLWIDDDKVEEAESIPLIKKRISMCEEYRKSAGRDAQKVASVPHRFCYRTHKDTTAIVFPKTTTERRRYVPCGYSNADTIINVDAFAIYDAELYVFSLLSSRLHVLWLNTTSGKLRTGHRYSVKLTYNTFPTPNLSNSDKDKLNASAINILSIRESHPELSLAEMYDPDRMPNDLLKAHIENDLLVENLYGINANTTDETKLALLLKKYRDKK